MLTSLSFEVQVIVVFLDVKPLDSRISITNSGSHFPTFLSVYLKITSGVSVGKFKIGNSKKGLWESQPSTLIF